MHSRSGPLAGVEFLAAVAAFALFLLTASHTGAHAAALSPFTVAHVQFEQNATDGDVEVVFEAKGGDEGLTKLTIVAPNGRTVVDFAAREASTLGMRQFRFESPEPKDVGSLKAAYPEGEYVFSGATASGATLQGKATLSHSLPATTTFVSPKPDAENVATRGLVLSWTPVKSVSGYIVYIEQDELNVNINAQLPGSTSTFAVPAGFLAPGTEYTMGLGTLDKNGNVSYVEASFTTGVGQ
jgi:hypothetical protein